MQQGKPRASHSCQAVRKVDNVRSYVLSGYPSKYGLNLVLDEDWELVNKKTGEVIARGSHYLNLNKRKDYTDATPIDDTEIPF